MTTPPPDDEPTSQIPPEPAAAPAEPAPQPEPAMAQSPQPTPGPYAYAGGPFAPVARAPRTPWVNPARRGHVAAVAIVAAVVLGGGGILIGHAIADDDDHRGVVRYGPVDGYGPRYLPLPGVPQPYYPRKQRPDGTATATPSPGKTS
jgi:hypothetical protein